MMSVDETLVAPLDDDVSDVASESDELLDDEFETDFGDVHSARGALSVRVRGEFARSVA